MLQFVKPLLINSLKFEFSLEVKQFQWNGGGLCLPALRLALVPQIFGQWCDGFDAKLDKEILLSFLQSLVKTQNVEWLQCLPRFIQSLGRAISSC